MSQTVVTNFYHTRKRYKDSVINIKSLECDKNSEIPLKLPGKTLIVDSASKKIQGRKVNKVTENLKSAPENNRNEKEQHLEHPKHLESTQKGTKSVIKGTSTKGKIASKNRSKKVNKVTNYLKAPSGSSDIERNDCLNNIKPSEFLSSNSKIITVGGSSKLKTTKASSKKINKVTNYLKPQQDTSQCVQNEVFQDEILQDLYICKTKNEIPVKKVTDIPETSKTVIQNEVLQDQVASAPSTPKRNLSNPDELTPSKKKPFKETSPISKLPLDKLNERSLSPQKVDPVARRKLHLNSPKGILSPRKITSPVKNQISPHKAATYENMSIKDLSSLVHESRSKVLFKGNLDELKKSLAKFSKASAKTKEFQANSCKISSVISSTKTSDSEQTSIFVGEPAYKKYSYLAAPETHSLILPYKYKLLGETFWCMDTAVSMLNNRKEKITFEKVQGAVQKMMNKNFLKSHLGKIITVLPDAYSLAYEKNDSYAINKNCSPYQLVIAPKLCDLNGNSALKEIPCKEGKKGTQNSFLHMSPQILLERKNAFQHNLINITKKHHSDFLTRINFPTVADNTIVRWHPKFNVDGVPDIPVAALPEEPETKISTAKEVLNKIRGSFRGRVEKALQSVADEHASESKERNSSTAESKTNSQIRRQSSALKGICSDLLEKIRARESAKLTETMTRSVKDEKRAAMLERLPKIVHIIWHYFIAERKAAVSVDAAVDKIIHSFNSLTTPEEVKEYLHLITETMPGWLSFIKIPKGEYITMNRKKDINEMISNLN